MEDWPLMLVQTKFLGIVPFEYCLETIRIVAIVAIMHECIIKKSQVADTSSPVKINYPCGTQSGFDWHSIFTIYTSL